MKIFIVAISIVLFLPVTSQAGDVNISKNLPYVDVDYKNNIVRIERNQDTGHTLQGGFAKTSRKCPPFCIQPVVPAAGVANVGELEVIDFVAKDVKQGNGVLIDARTPSWHKKGTIPGSVSIPFTTFDLDAADPELAKTFMLLGVTPKSKNSKKSGGFMDWFSKDDKKKNYPWDFSKAKKLILWCNGMWCGQSPRAIKGLIKHGYPAEKISYFRGGMQTWLILGLTVVQP